VEARNKWGAKLETLRKFVAAAVHKLLIHLFSLQAGLWRAVGIFMPVKAFLFFVLFRLRIAEGVY
jgi:hypothetical protein